MKKIINIAVVLLAAIIIYSCGGTPNTPRAVAEKFLNHLSKKEYEEAKMYGTENTKSMLDMMKSFPSKDTAQTKESTFEYVKTEENGDMAVCTFKKDGVEEKIPLVKKDGKWLVDLKKETLNKEGQSGSANSLMNFTSKAFDKMGEALDSVFSVSDSIKKN